MKIVSADQIHAALDWQGVLDALHQVHQGPRPQIDDYYLGDTEYGLFSRGVVLPGVGAGVKIASIFPANLQAEPPRPAEQAAFVVIDERTKAISAIFDGPAITAWKTAGDSVLAARRLSREDSAVLLVLGAGPVARALTEAYLHIRPGIGEVLLWNRTAARLQPVLEDLCKRGIDARIVTDLDSAVARADIITSATAAATPCVKGRLVRKGTHVDLVGGYRADMQEADQDLFAVARLFVDDRPSALNSGDLQIPLRAGIISENSIEADLFELCQSSSWRRQASDITVYKNAGGAHLDLTVCQQVLRQLGAGSFPQR